MREADQYRLWIWWQIL